MTSAPLARLAGTPLLVGARALVNAGAAHACGLSSNQIFCWGANAEGELGDGTRASRSSPVSITFSTGCHQLVTAGRSHSCVEISQEGLYCWGAGASGQLGDGARIDRLTPVRIVDP